VDEEYSKSADHHHHIANTIDVHLGNKCSKQQAHCEAEHEYAVQDPDQDCTSRTNSYAFLSDSFNVSEPSFGLGARFTGGQTSMLVIECLHVDMKTKLQVYFSFDGGFVYSRANLIQDISHDTPLRLLPGL